MKCCKCSSEMCEAMLCGGQWKRGYVLFKNAQIKTIREITN